MSAAAAFRTQPVLCLSEVCAQFPIPQHAKRMVAQGAGAHEVLLALLRHGDYETAVDFVAHLLPHREAIWWGCLCLQHACGDGLTGVERSACEAAVQWIMRPCEVTRLAAKPAAIAAGSRSPAGALAMAAHYTGGSLAGPNAPVVPPPPYLPAKSVAIAVKLVCYRGDRLGAARRQRAYVQLGADMMRAAKVI